MFDTEYDLFSKEFSASRQHAWPEFRLAFSLLNAHDRVLDLGCGNGRLRKYLDRQIIPDGHYFGLDISQGMLDIARKEFPQDHFFRGDFGTKSLFGADNFDVIIGMASFHHLMTQKERQTCLAELHRVLKPGGKIMLTTWKIPRKNFWNNLHRPAFWRSNFRNYQIPFGKEKHPRQYRLISAQQLSRMLKKAGFKVTYQNLMRGKNWVVMAEKQ